MGKVKLETLVLHVLSESHVHVHELGYKTALSTQHSKPLANHHFFLHLHYFLKVDDKIIDDKKN